MDQMEAARAKGLRNLKDGGDEAMEEGKKHVIWLGKLAASLAERMSLFTKLFVFLLVNGGLMIFLFSDASTYTLSLQLDSSQLVLQTNDYYLPVDPEFSPEVVANLTYLVHITHDAVGDPGWNLQDIMDVPRTLDVDDEYTTPGGMRMIQDYRFCTRDCLAADGRPKDLSSGYRNYTRLPYGWQAGDFYVDRDLYMRELDPDFYSAYLNNGTRLLAEVFDNWGQTATDINVSSTAPTDAK
eukprot:gene22315-29388_t